MASLITRRNGITLYCRENDSRSHRVRLVLIEKAAPTHLVMLDRLALTTEDLLALNPYQSIPTLTDRDLVLYNDQVIMEYLDERYPHPPLLPADPAQRAQIRMLVYRMDRDWYELAPILDVREDSDAQQAARKKLSDELTAVAPLFAKYAFANEEFTLADCVIAPLLWRLRYWRVELPPAAANLQRYGERIFARDGFQKSLTSAECLLRS